MLLRLISALSHIAIPFQVYTFELACPLSLGQTTPTQTNHTMPPRQSSVSVSRPGVSRLASWPGVPPPGPAPAHSNSFLPNSVDACE